MSYILVGDQLCPAETLLTLVQRKTKNWLTTSTRSVTLSDRFWMLFGKYLELANLSLIFQADFQEWKEKLKVGKNTRESILIFVKRKDETITETLDYWYIALYFSQVTHEYGVKGWSPISPIFWIKFPQLKFPPRKVNFPPFQKFDTCTFK